MPNYVLDQGLAAITALMASAVTNMAVGTSATAVDPAQTGLIALISDSGLATGDGAAATVSQQTTNTSNDTLRLVKAWTVTGTKAISEVCIQTAAGLEYARALTSAVKNVVAGDTISLTFNVVFTN